MGSVSCPLPALSLLRNAKTGELDIHGMTNQTPMKHGRELLRERVADLMLGVNVQELELVENGAVVAQRLERDVDVLDLGVLARVLDLLDARLVVFEEHNRAGLIVPRGVELGVEQPSQDGVQPCSFGIRFPGS